MRILVIILTFFSTTIYAQYIGDTWKDVAKNGKGKISVAYVETPSFAYVDDHQKPIGICIDIMNDFVKWAKEQKQIELQIAHVGNGSNFKDMYNKVKVSKGGVFGLGNITITEERKKEVKFSTPFITNFAILISQSSAPTLTSFNDMSKVFSGYNAYTAKGTLNEKRMLELKQKYYPDIKLTYTTTSQETLEKVFEDPKGIAYLDLAFYLEAVQLNKSIKRHPVADKAAEQFGIIMPNSTDWSEVFEEFVRADGGYYNSVHYKNILIKHLGEAGMKLMQSAAK